MAEIIYFKDVLLLKPMEKVATRKTPRSRLKPMKSERGLKSSLVERKKEDSKRN